MAHKSIYGNLGSISHGTMRPEDLIPVFVSELDRLARTNRRRGHLQLAKEIDERSGERGYYESEEADFDLEYLFGALNEYAPGYSYFGAHPGDGSDYGFWILEEIEEAVVDNGGVVINDLSRVPRGYTGEVLLINDHGNMTLYDATRGRLRKSWSIV